MAYIIQNFMKIQTKIAKLQNEMHEILHKNLNEMQIFMSFKNGN